MSLWWSLLIHQFQRGTKREREVRVVVREQMMRKLRWKVTAGEIGGTWSLDSRRTGRNNNGHRNNARLGD